MVIDPIISLAFSIRASKGVYALLLGSGVSRSAGIPTGWEIVLDLTRQLARLKGEDCEPEPEAWYKKTFGEAPDYSKLLDSLAKSSAERQQLLKRYFEPSEEERQHGLKMPTPAHVAVAELVAAGHVRVIVTTNFDRLPEKALEVAGIIPTVISTADAAQGAMPLTHSQCTVIKVNGDYLDTRIKNTAAELERYDKVTDQLLDRVFDEFGLVVCGWSGEWDPGLRAAIERCHNRRFTTYWTARGGPREAAQKLIDLKQATVVPIKEADSFFSDLAAKVKALDEVDRPHPLSAKMAVATLKRHLAADQKIATHDLVMAEVERSYAEFSERHFPVQGITLSAGDLASRLDRYEAISEINQALLITGCYWADEKYDDIWLKALGRIASPSGERSGSVVALNARFYPALLLLYSAGISAITAGKYHTLRSLLMKVKQRDGRDDPQAARGLFPDNVIDPNWARLLPDLERHRTPTSDHLYQVLRKPFAEVLPDDIEYQKAFDRYEYLFALTFIDLNKGPWMPVGRFAWNYGTYPVVSVLKEADSEVGEMGSEWPPLKAGFFGGDLEKLKAARTLMNEFIGRLGWGW